MTHHPYLPTAPFPFFDVPSLFTLVDKDLELVEPQRRYSVDPLPRGCHHPLTKLEMPVRPAPP